MGEKLKHRAAKAQEVVGDDCQWSLRNRVGWVVCWVCQAWVAWSGAGVVAGVVIVVVVVVNRDGCLIVVSFEDVALWRD